MKKINFLHGLNKTLACLLILVSVFCNSAWAQEVKDYPYDLAELPKGNGTATNPYKISSVYNLLWIAGCVNSGNELTDMYFVQTENIDMALTRDWSDGEGWMPIGGYFYYSGIMMKYGFKGYYNGDGYTISNIYINRPDYEYQGLFGYVTSGEVSNLNLENVEVTGLENVGGITAYMYSANITGCSVRNCKIKATDFYVGGISGYQDSGVISDCIVDGDITGQDYVGGIVSWINEGKVINCATMGSVTGVPGEYANARLTGGTACYTLRSEIDGCISMASVAGNEKVGGLIGAVSASKITRCGVIAPNVDGIIYVGGLVGENDNSVIEDCFARTSVKGSQDVGGLIGSSSYSDSRVTRCYAASEVYAEDETVMGGLIGIKSTGIVSGCYWDTEISGMEEGVGGFYHEDIQCEGKTSAELKDVNTYIGWDFDNIWSVMEGVNDGYPILKKAGNDILGVESIVSGNDEDKVSVLVVGKVISVVSDINISEVRIYDVSGKMVLETCVNGRNAEINTDKIESGVYIVSVVMDDYSNKNIKLKI